jgi:hypothetical protein
MAVNGMYYMCDDFAERSADQRAPIRFGVTNRADFVEAGETPDRLSGRPPVDPRVEKCPSVTG